MYYTKISSTIEYFHYADTKNAEVGEGKPRRQSLDLYLIQCRTRAFDEQMVKMTEKITVLPHPPRSNSDQYSDKRDIFDTDNCRH